MSLLDEVNILGWRRVVQWKFRWKSRLIKISDNFFSDIVAYSLIILGVCLVLDLIHGETVFQRSGAIIVGFAVLYVIQSNRLGDRIELCKAMLDMRKSWPFMVSSKDLNEAISHEDSSQFFDKIVNSTQYGPISSHLPQKTDEEIRQGKLMVAFLVLQDAMNSPKKIEQLSSQKKNATIVEIFLGFLGTLVWAFGDWLTNFFWHCDWVISCHAHP